MPLRLTRFLAAGTGILLLLLSCKDMTLLIPMGQNYQVTAQGEIFSLEEYAIIKKDEKIQPSFVYSVKNDPDIIEMTVSLLTGDRRETGVKISYTLMPENKTNNPEETGAPVNAPADIVFPLTSLDGILPAFSLPGDLKPGPYTLIFKVHGKRRTLISRTEETVYYLAEEDYAISGINAYLPAFSASSHMIPPETTMLLEAEISAGPNLDPYIIWYNGKSRIHSGTAAEGAGRILWEVPSRTGFENIRAEVLPFPPLPDRKNKTPGAQGNIHRGKKRELTLPVLAEEKPEEIFFIEENRITLRDFHLAGNLLDTGIPPAPDDPALPRIQAAGTLEKVPGSETGREPRWLPGGDAYGLALGPGDQYRLPFTLESSGETRISFILKFFSINEGRYFGLSLEPEQTAGEDNSGALDIHFVREEDSYFLITSSSGGEEKFPVELSAKDEPGFRALALDLSFNEDRLEFFLKEAETSAVLLKKTTEKNFAPRIRALLELGGTYSPAGVTPDKEAFFQDEAPRTDPALIAGRLAIVSSGPFPGSEPDGVRESRQTP